MPLAIEQAGAYLAQAGATPREYLDLLARYPAAMYQAAPEGGDAARTIARIWRVTLDRLADDPLPGQVLRILAWYAPDAIPRTLLDGLADPPAVLHAVGRLAAYSMLTADAGTLAMHRLVQAVTRTPDPGDPHRDPQAIDAARDQAAHQLAGALSDPRDPAGWPGWRMLLPHIDALAGRAPPDTDTQDTAYLLNEAGLFLAARASPAARPGTSSGPWPTVCGCWAPTIPPPWSRGTTSPTPTGRRGTWAGPSRCTSRPWPTACGCWAPTTPRP